MARGYRREDVVSVKVGPGQKVVIWCCIFFGINLIVGGYNHGGRIAEWAVIIGGALFASGLAALIEMASER